MHTTSPPPSISTALFRRQKVAAGGSRLIAPHVGRVYRDNTVNATHSVESHHIGWVIEDKNLALEDMIRFIVVHLEKKGVPTPCSTKRGGLPTVPWS